MNFGYGEKVETLRAKLQTFMKDHIYPNEKVWHAHTVSEQRWQPVPIIEELKLKARTAALWNLWRPKSHGGTLSNTEYAPLCEIMGRVHWAPEVFNCSAPDTGNMETLLRYGTTQQIETWCEPLLDGKIRSAFLMTEPDVASSDATNIQTSIVRDGADYVISGRKWWSSGAGDPRCKIFIVMGKTDPDNLSRHKQQSMILVPADTPGVKVLRHLPVFGFDDAPHGHMEIALENVRVPALEYAARRGARIRDRARSPRSRPHPPLHAPDRTSRNGPREDVQACSGPCRVRPPDRRPGRHARADSRGAHHDRFGTTADTRCGVEDGYSGQQGRPQGDRHDQGAGAQRRPPGHRLGDAGARRRRRVGRLRPRLRLCDGTHVAVCRRSRRSASRSDREAGASRAASRGRQS